MSNLLQQVESISKYLTSKIYQIGVTASLLVILLIAIDLQTHILSQLSLRFVKFIGNVAIDMGFLAITYYILRIIFTKLRKKNIFLPQTVDFFMVKTISTLRNFHPIAGILALTFGTIHGYILLFPRWDSGDNLTLLSGIMTLITLALLVVLGIKIRNNPRIPFRSFHKYVAAVFIIFYAIHKSYA